MSETIEENNILELVDDFDLIVDTMDNFHTRYLLNRTAIAKNIAFPMVRLTDYMDRLQR
ncbi:MAG: ThiF family adenylyltransferase [Dehalococcoidia bacterium]